MDRQTTTYFVTFLIVALIVALRIWRGSRERRLRVERLWIRPAIICAVLGFSIYGQPLPMTAPILLALAVATLVGLAVGVYRGRMVKVSINVDTHIFTSKTSPWGTLIFLGRMVVRIGARFALWESHDIGGITVNAIIDGLTLFYAGNVIGMQIDVWMRARKLLADAIAAKASGQIVPAEVSQDRGGEKAHG